MRYFFTFLIAIFTLGTSFAQERVLTMESKDSINGQPKYSFFIGANIKLAGVYDVYGGLQESTTFNVGKINVFGSDDTESLQMDLNQTQLKWETKLMTKNGDPVFVVIESDFLGGSGHLRLRKAFVEFKNWQLGQNWNNFGDEALWPNIMEWEGPPSGVWRRTPHIKYFNTFNDSNWSYELSLEAPTNDINSYKEFEPLVQKTYQNTPDLTAAISYRKDWGHLRLVSLIRKVNYKFDDDLGSFVGYGFGLSGKYQKSLSNFQFQITGGKGINAYLTTLSGFGYDGFPTINNIIRATPALGGWVAYEHFFTPKWHCNVVLGYTGFNMDDMKLFLLNRENNDLDIYAEGSLKNTQYYSLFNVMHDLTGNLRLGLEVDFGNKELQWDGILNDTYEISALSRDAMRISFGFFYFL